VTLPIMPPNMEALVSAYLRAQPEIIDELEDADTGDVHLYTSIPKDAPTKVARVTQLIDRPAGSPLWLVAYDVQVEAWGSKAEAWRVASICRALLDDHERFVGIHDGFGVVNGSTPGGLIDLPDEDFRPAVPRWLFTSTIYARPLANLTS
jgi:hypothetical protein